MGWPALTQAVIWASVETVVTASLAAFVPLMAPPKFIGSTQWNASAAFSPTETAGASLLPSAVVGTMAYQIVPKESVPIASSSAWMESGVTSPFESAAFMERYVVPVPDGPAAPSCPHHPEVMALSGSPVASEVSRITCPREPGGATAPAGPGEAIAVSTAPAASPATMPADHRRAVKLRSMWVPFGWCERTDASWASRPRGPTPPMLHGQGDVTWPGRDNRG